MPENNLYYIYIDSKIEGTIDQLMGYFQANIFDADACICVYFKYYKDIEKYIKNKFSSSSIRFKFIRKNSDLVLENHKVVFYLFNSQSNCRVVAHRHLTHIFVTHGESHKLASIKPIIRIYDFVVTSGQVGVERFLKSGVFNTYNILEEKRVLPMGNTFIGQNQYSYSVQSSSLLYAPTWEGGVSSENYSSIGVKALQTLRMVVEKENIKNLYIQPHPNLGHRDRRYISDLNSMMKSLSQLKIRIIVLLPVVHLQDRLKFRACKLIATHKIKNIQLRAAIVDISAMEMQLINKHIPTLVLCDQRSLASLIIPKRVQYLYKEYSDFYDSSADAFNFAKHEAEICKHREYLLSYVNDHLKNQSFKLRVAWLCQFATEHKKRRHEKNMDVY